MKTLELIRNLDEKQHKKFLLEIRKHPRKKLGILFHLLSKNIAAPLPKSEVFAAVFKTDYDEEKDYLLRNELRLLNKELETFIAKFPTTGSSQIEAYKTELNLLNRFFETGNEFLFESYYQETLTAALAQSNFGIAAQLYSLKSKFIFRHKEISIKNYREAKQLLSLENQATLSQLQEKLSENLMRQNFAQRVLLQLNDSKLEPAKTHHKNSLFDGAKLLVKYNELIAKSYLQSGEQKIKTLLLAAKIHPAVAAIRQEKNLDNISIFGNIAVEYFLIEKFDKAHQFYQKAILVMPKSEANIELLFNFCINGLALGQHKIFIEAAKKYQSQIAANNKLKHRFQYFTALAYLFDEKPKEAFKLLDHDISKRPENEYYFYRMVYAMAYYQLNDFDMASRELENILQSFRFRKPSENYDKPLVKAMQKLLSVHSLRYQKQKFYAELTKLKLQVAGLNQNVTRFSKTIYTWLNKQIEKL
jgi:tetratricopeptide (TPR) repeat protein